MTVRTDAIKEFADVGFKWLGNATKGLKQEQLDWKSSEHANTIRWILTHLSEELNVELPKLMGGEVPGEWPADYTGNTSYKLDKILGDIEAGKKKLYAGLEKLTDGQLLEEVEAWGMKKPRGWFVDVMVAELIHHEGQIAAILGVEKRAKGIK
jgi:uncharacterized damage-inducible protein DinB